MEKYNFLYCPKIVLFSKDGSQILLAKRQGEQDYDGIFSFVGGKMELTDGSILQGIRREKSEEIGENCKINVLPTYAHTIMFTKKDGRQIILPHYLAFYESGEVVLNDEYSEFQWVSLSDLGAFGPRIDNIPQICEKVVKFKQLANQDEFVLI